MKNRLLESIGRNMKTDIPVRRYSLAEMISESYKVVFDCKDGSNLKKLAESHLEDIRRNPGEIESLSENLSIIKELVKLEESGQINDRDLVEKKPTRKSAPKRVSESRRIRGRRLKESSESDGILRFKVGDEISYPMLYGGTVFAKVVSRTENSINVVEEWTAEDTGNTASAPETLPIEIDNYAHAERAITWEYRGETGGVYPPSYRYTYESRRLKDSCHESEDLDEADDVELTDEEVDELEKHLSEIRKKKGQTNSTPQKDEKMTESEGNYKLRIYKKSGSGKGNLDKEETFKDKESMGKRYKELFKREDYALNPTAWEKGESGEWNRIVGYSPDKKEEMTECGSARKHRRVVEDVDSTESGNWEFTAQDPAMSGYDSYTKEYSNGAVAVITASYKTEFYDEDGEIISTPYFSKFNYGNGSLEYAKREADEYVSGGKLGESVEDFDTNKGKEKLVDEECHDTVENKEERVIVKPEYCNESLKDFAQKSKGKAFMKTFKKLDAKLHEGTALTRQESIGLYKAANSAMTHLSVELEHNPEFLGTFKESVAILSTDVNKVMESISRGKAPSKNTMKSLAKFSEALLNDGKTPWYSYEEDDLLICNSHVCDHDSILYVPEDDADATRYLRNEGARGLYVMLEDGTIVTGEDFLYDYAVDESKMVNEAEDEDEEELDNIEAEDEDFVGDDEGDIESEEADEFDQEYADARVELHKELVANHADDEDPEIQEKIEQDAEEVVNLPGTTEEQAAEILGGTEEVEAPEEEPEEEIPAEDEAPVEDEMEEAPIEDDDSEITDDELAELKSHLKEMRKARKLKESEESDVLSKVRSALDDAGIRYTSRGRSGTSLLVAKKDLEKASEIRNKIDPDYKITVQAQA